MKRLVATMGMLLLCALCMGAQAEAVTAEKTPLLPAPDPHAQTLMIYYAGTPVEVVREADADYVQVNVGAPGGSLMGYMAKSSLALDERAARAVERDIAYFYANMLPCRLYSYPDVRADMIDDAYLVEDGHALGYLYGEWLHMRTEDGRTGFVSQREVQITRERHETQRAAVQIAGDDLSMEAAIEEAKRLLLEEAAAGTLEAIGMTDVTREGLDGCLTETRVFPLGTPGCLRYEIDFRKPDAGAYYAWIVLDVQDGRVTGHSFGNG